MALTQLKQITPETVTTRSAESMELVYQAGTFVNNPYFYVFNSNDKFVIVAGDDEVMPVLGYSDQGAFDPNNIPANMAGFLKGYEEEIKYARTANNVTTRSSVKSIWEKMIKGEINQTSKSSQGKSQTVLDKRTNSLRSYIEGRELIKTQWGQGGGFTDTDVSPYHRFIPLYNYYCPNPYDMTNYSPTGCVATAMGQIIRYWGNDKGILPNHGYGSNSYTPEKHPEFGQQSADFANAKYDYSIMPVSLDNKTPIEHIKEVAHLLYHCGIAVNMDYGTVNDGGSVSSIDKALNALKNNFAFPNAKLVSKTTEEEWESIIKNEIFSERPVLYSGTSATETHVFICDGYQSSDNTFHINWGWGGNNGFFLLTALKPKDDDYSVNNNKAIINIAPISVVPPTSLTITPSETTLRVSKKENLSYTILPKNATFNSVNWATSDEKIVKVTKNGTITAIAPGEVTITATTLNGEKTATCKVFVPVDVKSLSISPTQKSIVIGDTTTLTATLLPDTAYDKTLIWSSGNTNVATVSENGLVKGIAAGTAIISVTSKYDNSKTDTCKILVIKPVTDIALSSSTIQVATGSKEKISVIYTPFDSNNKRVRWSSEDESIATVWDGEIKGVKEGKTKITVITEDSLHSATCEVTVKNIVDRVILNKHITTMVVGANETLTYTIKPDNASNKNVTWSSNEPYIADVDANGKITARASGVTYINVITVDGSRSDNCRVEVKQPVTGISLNKASTYMLVNGTEELKWTITPADATDKNINCTSNAPSVAAIDKNGKIIAIGKGDADITITTADGKKTAKCKVIVTDDTTAVEGITITPTSLNLTAGETSVIKANITPAKATNQNIIWYSSDNSVATVNNGTVTARNKGTATITAKSRDGNFTATCDVSVENQFVKEIFLFEKEISLAIGSIGSTDSTKDLRTYVLPITANNKKLIWTTADPTVATVDNGTVKAVGKGTTTIKVTAEDGSGIFSTCTVKVIQLAEQIIAHPDSLINMNVGDVINLTWEVLPSTTDNKDITCSSSNEGVVQIIDGVLRATNKGYSEIWAKAGDGNYMLACKINVIEPVTGIKLDRHNIKIHKGRKEPLIATVTPDKASDNTVVWASKDKDIATVDTLGQVTAVSLGKTKIIATTIDGNFIDGCDVEVTTPVDSIFLDRTAILLHVEDTATLTPTINPANASNLNIIWSSSNKATAIVDDNGNVIGKKPGTAIISATTEDEGKTSKCVITVYEGEPPVTKATSVSLTPSAITIEKGNWEILSAGFTPTNADNQNVTWISSNPSVATITSSGNGSGYQLGKVEALEVGNTTITVKTEDGSFSATCDVTVAAATAVTGVSLSNDYTLAVGSTYVLKEIISPLNATNKAVTWSSDDTSTVTVNDFGKITGINTGTAHITVTTKDGGFTATCTVKVVPATSVTGVSLNNNTLSLAVGNTSSLIATISPSDATDKTVKWESDNKEVATVDENGKVTGISAGTAHITVTTNNGGFTATCTVTVVSATAVTGVSIDKNTLTLAIGGTDSLIATVSPSDATNKTVTWSSDNENVAKVDKNGKVTGISNGTAHITVITKDGGFSAICTVTVNGTVENIPVLGISIKSDTNTVSVGKKLQLQIIFDPENATNKNVTWASSDTSIVKIDTVGVLEALKTDSVTIRNLSILSSSVVVEALKVGSAIITATSQDGNHTATFALTVSNDTGTEKIQLSSVWAYNNKIYVNTPVAADIRIYSISGILVHHTKIPEGQYTTEMYRGTYIVIVGNNPPIKVLVK